MSLEKFYHDLNEKVITATNTLGNSALKGNLSKNQELN